MERFSVFRHIKLLQDLESLSTPTLEATVVPLNSSGRSQLQQLPLQGQLHILGKPTKSYSKFGRILLLGILLDKYKDLCSVMLSWLLQHLS